MSILIVEQQRIEKSDNPLKVVHNKPIIDALNNAKTLYKLPEIKFIYSLDSPKNLSYSKYHSTVDLLGAFLNKIDNYTYIILLGKHLVKHVLGVELKKVSGKVVEQDNKFYLCLDSSFNTQNKNKTLDFSLILDHYFGYVLKKDLVSYEIVTTLERLKEVVEYRHITKIVAFDFETTGLDFIHDEATILSITYQAGYSYIIPFEHFESPFVVRESYNEKSQKKTIFNDVISLLNVLFSDASIKKVGHHLKFDWHFLTRYGIKLRGVLFDTQIAAHLLDENLPSYSLKKLSASFFPYFKGYDDDVDFFGDLTQLAQYCAMDTHLTLCLYYIYNSRLCVEPKLYRLFKNMSMPLQKVLYTIEQGGVLIDKPFLLETIELTKEYIKLKESELYSFDEVNRFILHENKMLIKKEIERLKTAKKPNLDKIKQLRLNTISLYNKVNFNSPKQVSSLFYDKHGFGFKEIKIKGKLTRTTSKDHIRFIESDFIVKYRAYKTLTKILSTYLLPYLTKLDSNNRIHGSFYSTGTVTGRLASSNPNLQNIMSRIDFDDVETLTIVNRIKEMFIAPKNKQVYQFDFSQAELRVIANVSQDTSMIQAYKNNIDLHSKTGAAIGGIPLADFDKTKHKDLRQAGKGANFGMVFKTSDNGYIANLKAKTGVILSKQEATKHRKAIFGTYPKLREWHTKTEHRVRKYKYVENLFGRKRRLPNIDSTNKRISSEAIRQAINSPIQGGSSDYVLFCYVLLFFRLPSDVEFWGTVHDSYLFYMMNNERNISIIKETTENPPIDKYFDLKLDVPMKIDCECGNNWKYLKEIDL